MSDPPSYSKPAFNAVYPLQDEKSPSILSPSKAESPEREEKASLLKHPALFGIGVEDLVKKNSLVFLPFFFLLSFFFDLILLKLLSILLLLSSGSQFILLLDFFLSSSSSYPSYFHIINFSIG